MDWLSVAGAIFLTWLVLVFLFTPGINYHLACRTSVHADDFLYTLQSTCQTALHHGNRITVYTNGPHGIADADRIARRLDARVACGARSVGPPRRRRSV